MDEGYDHDLTKAYLGKDTSALSVHVDCKTVGLYVFQFVFLKFRYQLPTSVSDDTVYNAHAHSVYHLDNK